MDAISTDFTGPIAPSDPDGKQYLHTIVDAATGHMTGAPLTRKSDVATIILHAIQRLQLSIRGIVMRYLANNARKQHTQTLLHFLKAQGTDIPTTSQSNAICERPSPQSSTSLAQPLPISNFLTSFGPSLPSIR